MLPIKSRVLEAFSKTKNIKDMNKSFEAWKYELRHHDITCDVINALDGVPQGTFYHPEFDALKHTWYVCRAILKLQRVDLLEAAFLHDYGKSSKTTIGENRIYHFGHSVASVAYINKIKDYLDNYELTRRMADEHMKYDVNNKHLNTDIDLHDMIVADKELSKEMYLKEVSHLELYRNQVKEEAVHIHQCSSKKKLYVTIGASGTGKSTYLKKHFSNEIIVNSDNIRRELLGSVNNQSNQDEIWNYIIDLMKINIIKYNKVVLDATNINKWLRIQFMSNFNNCKKIAIIFNGNVNTSVRRIKQDIANNIDRANVPENVIRKQFKLFDRGYNSIKNEFNEIIEIDCG